MNANTDEIDNLPQSNSELRKKLEHLERYSRDLNIRVLGVSEEDGGDSMVIILNYITRLGLKHAAAEVENEHRTGKKQGERPRHIIAKLYSRPFKRKLLQAAKSAGGKAELNEERFVEDFTPSDFETRKKALPLMRKAFEEGKRVRFTKGKLFCGQKGSLGHVEIYLSKYCVDNCFIFFSLLTLHSTAKTSANVHCVMISCVSHLLVQSCTSANFVSNSFAVNLFICTLFVTVILQTSYYSYISKLSLYGSNYWKISVIILGWLFNYRYIMILLLNFNCPLCFFIKNGEG